MICRTRICSSVPAAISGSAISCFGTAPTPNSISPRCFGRISVSRRFARRWPNLRPGSAGSVRPGPSSRGRLMLWQRLLTRWRWSRWWWRASSTWKPRFAAVLGVVVLLGRLRDGPPGQSAQPDCPGGVVCRLALVLWLAWRYLPAEQVVYLQWIMAIWWVLMTIALVIRRSELPRVHGSRPAILLLGGLVLVRPGRRYRPARLG